MIHIDPQGRRRDFDLAWFSKESARMANAFRAAGLAKGDRVMNGYDLLCRQVIDRLAKAGELPAQAK